MDDANTVTVKAENVPLREFLQEIFKEQPLEYSIENKAVIVSRKFKGKEFRPVLDLEPPITVKGRVVDEEGKTS